MQRPPSPQPCLYAPQPLQDEATCPPPSPALPDAAWLQGVQRAALSPIWRRFCHAVHTQLRGVAAQVRKMHALHEQESALLRGLQVRFAAAPAVALCTGRTQSRVARAHAYRGLSTWHRRRLCTAGMPHRHTLSLACVQATMATLADVRSRQEALRRSCPAAAAAAAQGELPETFLEASFDRAQQHAARSAALQPGMRACDINLRVAACSHHVELAGCNAFLRQGMDLAQQGALES
jgi:hypothetical protein